MTRRFWNLRSWSAITRETVAFTRRWPPRYGKQVIPRALEAWQTIERKSRSGSERWLRAKLHEALIYEKANDRPRTAATVNVVKRLYPDMGGSDLKQQFLDVLKRSQ